MKTIIVITYLSAVLLVAFPVAAHAFWGSESVSRSGLDLTGGYDTNTVTIMTGRVVAVQVGDDRRNAQLEIDGNGSRTTVILGPSRYWAENGIALKVGDDVTVRGSKAQGQDGVVYIMAQKITDTSQNTSASLRSESGRPAWSGGGMGNGAERMNNRQSPMRQSPGRMGGGRMGR
jgi:hypothetical protein